MSEYLSFLKNSPILILVAVVIALSLTKLNSVASQKETSQLTYVKIAFGSAVIAGLFFYIGTLKDNYEAILPGPPNF